VTILGTDPWSIPEDGSPAALDPASASPAPGIAVAEAIPAHAAAFAAFFRAAWRQAGPDAPGFAGATEEVIDELTTPDAFAVRIGGPVRRMFLAWEAEAVVGFAATTRVDATEAELAGIIVLESATGRGVGGALVEAAATAMAEAGHRAMVVRTEVTNERARGFYEHHGFALTGTDIEHVNELAVEVAVLRRKLR
jgi:ribosomal protein S18 acetylase RimI-like enzyme